MAQLLVRNLDETLVRQLKIRAVAHGISAEEEHRRILQAALNREDENSKGSFKDHLLSLAELGDDDISFERPRTTGRRNLFEE